MESKLLQYSTTTNITLDLGYNTSSEKSLAIWQVIFIYYSKLGGDVYNMIPLLRLTRQIEMFLNHDHDVNMMIGVSKTCEIHSIRTMHDDGLEEWAGTEDMVFHLKKSEPFRITIYS